MVIAHGSDCFVNFLKAEQVVYFLHCECRCSQTCAYPGINPNRCVHKKSWVAQSARRVNKAAVGGLWREILAYAAFSTGNELVPRYVVDLI